MRFSAAPRHRARAATLARANSRSWSESPLYDLWLAHCALSVEYEHAGVDAAADVGCCGRCRRWRLGTAQDDCCCDQDGRRLFGARALAPFAL